MLLYKLTELICNVQVLHCLKMCVLTSWFGSFTVKTDHDNSNMETASHFSTHPGKNSLVCFLCYILVKQTIVFLLGGTSVKSLLVTAWSASEEQQR